MGVDLASPRGWRTVGASVAGTSHTGAGEPCADSCGVRVLPATDGGSILIAVAADGAGSSERAAEGARLACETILDEATFWATGKKKRRRRRATGKPRARRKARGKAPADLSTFHREHVLSWVESARQRITEAAESEGLVSRDFSCTLLAALVGETSAVFFHVGDGAIVYRAPDGEYVPVFWPQNGEYANCTWFVTDEEAPGRVQSARGETVHEVALLTDGLQGLALRFGSREAHDPFFKPMFARLRTEAESEPHGLREELETFLDSEPVNRRTDDDKTLVLATRLAVAAVGEVEGKEA